MKRLRLVLVLAFLVGSFGLLAACTTATSGGCGPACRCAPDRNCCEGCRQGTGCICPR